MHEELKLKLDQMTAVLRYAKEQGLDLAFPVLKEAHESVKREYYAAMNYGYDRWKAVQLDLAPRPSILQNVKTKVKRFLRRLVDRIYN